MKRKNIIGLSVFSKKTGEIIGVVQELKMDRENANIASFIVTRETKETKDNSLILPFNRATLNDDDLESNIEDMMTIDSIMYYNESRKSEQFFSPKSIYDSESNNIGIVTDFDFNKRTGILDNILYFNTSTKRVDSIERKWIKNFYDYDLKVKTVEELRIEEEIELEKKKSEEKVREALNYFKNMELEAKMYASSLNAENNLEEESKVHTNTKDYTNRLDEIINAFKSDLKFEQEKLRDTYMRLEKELIDEYEKTIVQLQTKRDTMFDGELLVREQDYLKTLEDLYNKTLNEISNLNSSIFSGTQTNKPNFVEPEPSLDKNMVESNVNSFSSSFNEYNQKEDDHNTRNVDTKKFIDEVFNQESNNFNKNFNNNFSVGSTENKLDNKLENNFENSFDNIQIPNVQEVKPNDDMFDNNKELEKLYELQRKRMNILKKL